MNIRKCKKILLIVILFFVIFEFLGSSTISYASTTEQERLNKLINLLTNGLGGILSLIIWIPKLSLVIITFIIDEVFGKLLGVSGQTFVTPLDIFFNRFDFFSINIFDTTSGPNVMKEIKINIAKWFVFFRTIASAILLVILIYVGIRMAITTVASEEAKWKNMLVDWVASLALIYVIQYFAIFIIYANDAVVSGLDIAFNGTGSTSANMDQMMRRNNETSSRGWNW